VADASNLPVMLYDIPFRTALKIETDTMLRAAEHPNIVAVKDASNDFGAVTQLAARMPEGFEIYSGNDDQTLAYQAIGAVGVVSVVGHVMGRKLLGQFEAFAAGELDRAREIQFLEARVHAALCASNPIPIKAAMTMLGFAVGAPRPPLRPATSEEEDAVRQALQTIGAL
jgi:4-hydroxy-tetrahydrodipicolinate synthase